MIKKNKKKSGSCRPGTRHR